MELKRALTIFKQHDDYAKTFKLKTHEYWMDSDFDLALRTMYITLVIQAGDEDKGPRITEVFDRDDMEMLKTWLNEVNKNDCHPLIMYESPISDVLKHIVDSYPKPKKRWVVTNVNKGNSFQTEFDDLTKAKEWVNTLLDDDNTHISIIEL